nr:RNA-directed DNA polymerase, eukaryota, reverse transcriptase zinc-binding domain protein [Tanacetum cinerariifolium]GEX75873.1 RNA-directed DNA polymerase, eukaryota, reverse transcriptase zinc-binding domain protein [Tanacetum cinerariifolium]
MVDTDEGNDRNGVNDVMSAGKEVVVFDEEIVREGSRKWALTLCGRFVGCKMSYSELRYNLVRMWGRFRLREISTQNGVFLFKFRESEGMSYVLENGPWMVNNKPLMVQKWEPDVVIDKSEPKSLPCWIKLHNIPLEPWTSKGISAIASGLGKPLIMDKTTTMICKDGHGNYGYARVLVEIQADKEFKDVVKICYKSNDQRTQCSKFVNVKYSWKPLRCCKCKVLGHDDKKYGTQIRTDNANGEKCGNERNDKPIEEHIRVPFGKKNNYKGENNRRMKDGQGNKKLQTRVEYRPVVRAKGGKEMAQTQVQKSNDSNMNKPPPSPKSPISPWRISKENVEELRRSANKYAILEEIDEDGDQESQTQNGREIWETIWKNTCLDEEDVYDDMNGISINIESELRMAAWNVRGLCNSKMQKDVKNFISEENLSICVVLETHIKDSKVKKICDFVFGSWTWYSNMDKCDRDCRIAVGWNEDNVNIMVIEWREKLLEIQKKIDKSPQDANCKKQEAMILKEFNVARRDEEKLLKQNAKIVWW